MKKKFVINYTIKENAFVNARKSFVYTYAKSKVKAIKHFWKTVRKYNALGIMMVDINSVEECE